MNFVTVCCPELRAHVAGTWIAESATYMFVHGGPWARDFWGYNAAAQWFANRGYATLQVNYRGSSGYSKSFLHKGDKQWGIGTMQHDLTDAVRWAR